MDRSTSTGSIPFALTAAVAWPNARTAGAAEIAQATAPANPSVKPIVTGTRVFPGRTNLDFAGAHAILSRPPSAKGNIIGKTLEPIPHDAGNRVLADTLFSDAPELDILFVRGGPGTEAMMQGAEILDFFGERAPRAKYVTSVCTRSLVLGAAGLLRGYKAASHWTTMEILPILGATPVHERVFIDRNRMTGGGATAGIESGLTLVDRVWGREMAETVQLANDYDPHPPFNAGSPRTAPARSVAAVRAIVHDGVADMTLPQNGRPSASPRSADRHRPPGRSIGLRSSAGRDREPSLAATWPPISAGKKRRLSTKDGKWVSKAIGPS